MLWSHSMARSPTPREISLPSDKLYINGAAHAAAWATFNAFTEAACERLPIRFTDPVYEGDTAIGSALAGTVQNPARSTRPSVSHDADGAHLPAPCACHAMREVSCITGGWHLRVAIVHVVRKG